VDRHRRDGVAGRLGLRSAVAGGKENRPGSLVAGSRRGGGDGAELRNPMGVIAIGGLITSTLLTLVVVPIAYTLVDDAQAAVVRALHSLRSRSPGC
jgi:hypothetical protein